MTENLILAAASGAAGAIVLMLAGLRVTAARRRTLEVASKWTRMPAAKAGAVVAGLTGAAIAFASAAVPPEPAAVLAMQLDKLQNTDVATLLAVAPGASAQMPAATDQAPAENGADDDNGRRQKALSALRDFAGRVEAKKAMIAGLGSDGDATAKAGALADVDTMMARLRTRLESEPGDIKGWMMLGWSYANTARYQDALNAYETALKLDAANPEIKSALDDVKNKLATIAKTVE